MLKVYQPKVEFFPIYVPRAGRKPYLRYNHDVDIVRFKGRILAGWNANEVGLEGVPGQFNFLSVSDDFVNWSSPVRLFCSEAGCENPVESDNQWQPAFINYKDETLFCAWCDMNARRVFVSESSDGLHWRNREVSNAPASLINGETGFPTNHGFITSKNVMIFPCSLPPSSANYLVGSTRYAATLLSFDCGKTWEWSAPIEAENWSKIGVPSDWLGEQIVSLWEPAIFERADGSLELLVRNSTAQERPEYDHLMRPEQMLLYAVSHDSGRTWSRCRPAEIDSTYSRNLTLSQVKADDSLLMVMNDWPVNVPRRIPHDRYQLALFLAAGGNPDLMLPGPRVQPEGGFGFYPNGFVENDTLYLAYTYPATIMGTRVSPLPDFSQPFLLPRDGRRGLKLVDNEAYFCRPEATLGVVFSESQSTAESVTLSFRMQSFYRRCETAFPLFTVGGKTRNGAVVELVYNEAAAVDQVQIRLASGHIELLGDFPERDWIAFELTLAADAFSLKVGALPRYCGKEMLLRKFAFGGLYVKPEWPAGTAMWEDIRLDLNSLRVEGV